MTIWIDSNNILHDDMEGEALNLPNWPIGMTKATVEQINPTITLAAAQNSQNLILAAAYKNAITQPVSYTSRAGIGKTYQADANSVANVQATLSGLSAALATPTGFYWVSTDNMQVPFEYADIQGLANTMLTQGWMAFSNLQSKKKAVLAATTVAEAQSVTWL